MRLLQPHQMKQQQLKLLETGGHSLAEYAESKGQHKILLNSQNTILLKSGELQIKWLKSAGEDSNSNLKAFVYVLLHRIYSVSIQQSLLTLIKSAFYNSELDLSTVKGHSLSRLSNSQMKKLVVQFFYLLGYSFFDDKIEAKLDKYPILMNIFVIFLRKILSQLRLNGVQDYNNPLPTSQIYSLLTLYFRLNLQTEGNCYVFPEARMVVMHHQQSSQYHLGMFTCQVAPSIKFNEPSKLSLRTVEASSKSQEDPDSPSKASSKSFFPKKSVKVKNQQILKESTKTYESLKELKEGSIKKTKSLNQHPKRKLSNIEPPYQIKAISTYDLTQATKTECPCRKKKLTKMTLRSNIYELNISFAKKSSQGIHGDCYIISKGFNCELFETRKPQNKFMRKYFQQKKLLQTEHVEHPFGGNAKNDAIATVGLNETNTVALRRPVSQHSQTQLHFLNKQPNSIQNKPAPAVFPRSLKPSPSFLKFQQTHCKPSLKSRNSTLNPAPKDALP